MLYGELMNFKIYCVIILIILISNANADNAKSDILGRFSGRIEAGGIYLNSNSQIFAYEVSGIDKRIDDLEKSESNVSLGIPILLFEINYEVKEDLLIFFGTPFYDDGREGLSFGAEYLLDNGGLLNVSLFADSTGVWKDPYVLNENREFTFDSEAGVNISFSDIMGSNFFLIFSAITNTITDDISGNKDSRLNREGIIKTFKPGYAFNLGNSSISSSLTFERNTSKGSAYSYNRAGAEFSIEYDYNQNSIMASVASDATRYSNINPIFKKKVKHYSYNGSIIYTWKNLWDTNWYFRLGGQVHYLNSNTDFFEHTIYQTGMSIGYSFE